MARVLIVSSMSAPYLAADMHRARLLSIELPRHGWSVELLVPGDEFQLPDYCEPFAGLLPVIAPVHRAKAELRWFYRAIRSRSLGVTAYRPLRRLGDRLLGSGRFDLVYISCAQSSFFHLGVRWRKRYGVPFIIDVHDPWYSPVPPTQHLAGVRRQVSNSMAKRLERKTLEAASGMVSVSRGYLDTFNRRYSGRNWVALKPERQAVIPFGASEADLAAASRLPAVKRPVGVERVIVYTGAGGQIMERSFRFLTGLLSTVKDEAPELLRGVRVDLVGTEPAAATGEPVLSGVIMESSLDELVFESPTRVSYLEALRRCLDADGLLVLGIDDPAYCPSKLFLYGLCGKPLLACMTRQSEVDSYFREVPSLGELIHFPATDEAAAKEETTALKRFLALVQARRTCDQRQALEPWLVEGMGLRHARFFENCLSGEGARESKASRAFDR